MPYESRLIEFAACSNFPLRTNHHGDSGAKAIPIIKGIGQTHCTANGILYAH